MITLHYLNNSRAQRILWLLEELGLEYDVKTYNRNPVTIMAPASLRKIHALGKSPVITDDKTDVTLAESGAIIEYLIDTYANGQFKPKKEDAAYWDYVYWMHYAEGSLMPPLLVSLVITKMREAKMPFFIKPIAKMLTTKVMAAFVSPNVKSHMSFIDAHLAKHEWFAGDEFSAADVQMSFPLEASVTRGIASSYPNICAYVKRFQAREAYQKALNNGTDYAYATKQAA